jgi:hypothetical protein
VTGVHRSNLAMPPNFPERDLDEAASGRAGQ